MSISRAHILSVAALLACVAAQPALGQAVNPQAADSVHSAARHAARQADTTTKIEVYGFAQADAVFDFRRSNPQWFDVNRPSRLSSDRDEFGNDHNFAVSARQSRFGVKATIPTGGTPINVVWDWDLFGVGTDAGQTTIRPRHMYGQWGKFGGGLLESAFMDVDVFPNILDYWGPNGMLFFRNAQIFWEPIRRANGTRLRLALERPGASGDAGIYADRIELQNIKPRFPAPDISGHFRYAGSDGYVQLGGMLRWIYWDDLIPNDAFDLDGHVTGWGTSLSSSLNVGASDVLRVLAIYGAGVENYFNDAPIDVGLKLQPGNLRTPVTGEALKDLGVSAFIDHRWTSKFTTAIGYAVVDIDNSNGQADNAFKTGQYSVVNLLWNPLKDVMMGGEFQWARRENFAPFTFDDYRMQFSVKYNFSQKFGGNHDEGIRAQN